MPFKRKVHRANQHGSKKIILDKNATGPDGEDIAVGDTVTVKIVGVEKQGEE